jgi:hypothetical protein
MRINGLKCIFHTKEVEFLGYIMGLNGIKMDLKKNIGNLRLANITKYDRDLRVYRIRELLSIIY